MYDLSRQSTAEHLQAYWLPQISRKNPKVPIIIVGNKLDLKDSEEFTEFSQENSIKKIIKPMIRDFKQVEMGLECSVKQYKNIPYVIYCANRAVLFPLSPLYDFNQKTLTIEMQKALARIFRMSDKDNDNLLSDFELKAFHNQVFKNELNSNDIRGIKEIIKDDLRNNSNDYTITLEGFWSMHKRIIERMKLELCWVL